MKKILIISGTLILALMVFGAGIYASEYITFAGDEQIAESNDHIDEIMDILRDVQTGKIVAETDLAEALERLKELEDMNPPGLAKENKRLREENKTLNDNISMLEDELRRANTKVKEHNEKTLRALEEAREMGGK